MESQSPLFGLARRHAGLHGMIATWKKLGPTLPVSILHVIFVDPEVTVRRPFVAAANFVVATLLYVPL
jgi:hypothetical protein